MAPFCQEGNDENWVIPISPFKGAPSQFLIFYPGVRHKILRKVDGSKNPEKPPVNIKKRP